MFNRNFEVYEIYVFVFRYVWDDDEELLIFFWQIFWRWILLCDNVKIKYGFFFCVVWSIFKNELKTVYFICNGYIISMLLTSQTLFVYISELCQRIFDFFLKYFHMLSEKYFLFKKNLLESIWKSVFAYNKNIQKLFNVNTVLVKYFFIFFTHWIIFNICKDTFQICLNPNFFNTPYFSYVKYYFTEIFSETVCTIHSKNIIKVEDVHNNICNVSKNNQI